MKGNRAGQYGVRSQAWLGVQEEEEEVLPSLPSWYLREAITEGVGGS